MDASKTNNDLTLEVYAANAKKYIANTPTEATESEKAWIQEALNMIPRDGRILEIGSGSGRDPRYIRSLGYNIEPTDAVQSFVDRLRSEDFPARRLNVLKQDLGIDYDMVFANAVLVHFTADETAALLDKIHVALNDDGIFAFRVKGGDGAGWSDVKLGVPRFFQYWQKPELRRLVEQHGFEIAAIGDGQSTRNTFNWILVIVRKV